MALPVWLAMAWVLLCAATAAQADLYEPFIEAGWRHTCFLLDDGDGRCYGMFWSVSSPFGPPISH